MIHRSRIAFRLLWLTVSILASPAWVLSAQGEDTADAARALLDRFETVDWDSRAVSEEKDLADEAWKVRIEVEHEILALGKAAVPTLIEACESENAHVRGLAAWCLGCLEDRGAVTALVRVARDDSFAPARVLALEALGRLGAGSEDWIAELAEGQDAVGRAAAWAVSRSRDGSAVGDSIRDAAIAEWNPGAVGAAAIGLPAPDFDLESADGSRVRLSDYRGKSTVVLVFMLSDG